MYQGAKFRPTGETYNTVNRQGEIVTREKFVPTSGYAKYLEEQRKLKRQTELDQLRTKLEQQMRDYGEVDDIDFQYFLSLAKSVK